MAKNNRVRVTQNKTYSFKLDAIKYIEAESKRTEKSSAQILDEAIKLHADMTAKVPQNAQSEHSNVISES